MSIAFHDLMLAAESDIEKLLLASHEILRLRKAAELSAAAMDEQTRLILCQRQEIARLNLRITTLEVRKPKWPINDLNAKVQNV